MITFTIKEKLRFFEPCQIVLPDLCIITGLNGSGKTFFLNSIKTQSIENDFENYPILIKLIDSSSFKNVTEEQHLSQYELLSYSSAYESHLATWTAGMSLEKSPQLQETYNKIARFVKKNPDSLVQDDFKNFFYLNLNARPEDVFYKNFILACTFYAKILRNNNYKKFLNLSEGKTNKFFMSSDEFLEFYGEAPWDFVNKIFASLNINYSVETPEFDELDTPFNLYLINNKNGTKIKFDDLSSGEQVIISIAFSIYNTNSEFPYPKILLMDEPDASLHPSMIKYFLNVVEEVFVKDKGIKVIMTTHNPTTVALAPKDSIYTMIDSKPYIQSNTRDAALKILTEGVPSFSINYENRRQIFVESPYDVKYYERLYAILSPKLKPEISLNFIASGDVQKNEFGVGKHSCDNVKEITTLMRGYGNNFIWGIIDWDRNTEMPECQFVSVLGWKQRYSIENYLFDPLLVAALLLREKYIDREELGLSADETYIDLKTFDSQKLQAIADNILDKLHPFLTDKEALAIEGYTEVTLLNNLKINLPNWFLLHQGHKLEEAYIKAFDELKTSKKNKEELLKLEIINKVIDDIPDLMSVDILDLLQDIQK